VNEAAASHSGEGESSQQKEGQKEKAIDTPEDREKSRSKPGAEVREEDGVWPYFVENTLDELNHGERKWLLFQLVCCQPVFLQEVELGFPMSLVLDQSECENIEGSEGFPIDVDDFDNEDAEEEKKKDVMPKERGKFMEIRLPKEEWLLTYCQIRCHPLFHPG
jgi:hypothetical protein